MLQKRPNGVSCLDSKGMTPLMRASQRNNFKCIEYLLNETNSDLNGSSRSTYTPLWFAVSNGYTDLAKYLLDFNTYPSILIDKSNQKLKDLQRATTSASGSSLYLFSPLRASIVYSKFQIMIYLLQYGANVYELFGSASINLLNNNNTTNNNNLKQLINNNINNEDYVNSLKFFHRQLFEHENYFCYLNSFIQNKNVYRRMMLEFVKNIFYKIKSNYNLMCRLDGYYLLASSLGQYQSVEYIIDIISKLEMEKECENNYLEIIKQFISLLDEFINTELINNETNLDNLKYKNEFLKSNHLEMVLNQCALPNHLINYLLYK